MESKMYKKEKTTEQETLTFCRSRTCRSLKHVACDPPPKISTYLSACTAAAWSDLGDGGTPLQFRESTSFR